MAKKRAVVVIGDLTGNWFSDNSFNSTGLEAYNDFKRDGYDAILIEQPTLALVQHYLSDENLGAFCFVGHGANAGDSKDSDPTKGGGNDLLQINHDEAIHAWQVAAWRRGKPTMDIAILHSCYQGTPRTSRRWVIAFQAQKVYSWIQKANPIGVYWFQQQY